MPATHRTVEHHASAAGHHEQAARYHREASRHFEVGKDFAHAAHQSIIAHGHTLQAISRGNEARAYYAEHSTIPAFPESSEATEYAAEEALAIAGVPLNAISNSMHHLAAAVYHTEAAEHHNQASKHCVTKDYLRAARETDLACSYAENAFTHSNIASNQRIEHSGETELVSAVA
jgi:hypothetical protein